MSEENNQNDEKPKESLEDLARKRKERLQQLRNRAQNHGTSDDKNSIPLPKYAYFIYLILFLVSIKFCLTLRPVFRNYKPQDEKLKEAVLPDADPENVEEVVKDQLEAAKSKVIINQKLLKHVKLLFLYELYVSRL